MTSVNAARIKAHAAFDKLWKSGEMSRSEAYAWLALKMGVPPEKCHMKQFNVNQCREVARLTMFRKSHE